MSLLNLLIPAFTGFVFMIPVLMLWFHHLHRSGHSVSRLHQAGVYLFCYYLFGVWFLTGMGPLQRFEPDLSLLPSADLLHGTVDTILNVILLVPPGMFLPMRWRRFHRFSPVVTAGVLVSLLIETLQMFGLGITDINDLITNTLGTCAGYGLYRLLAHWMPENAARQFQQSPVSGRTAVMLAVTTSLLMAMYIQKPVLKWLASMITGG